MCQSSFIPALSDVAFLFRLSAVTRLFRILQDVINPSFEVEGRHWRSSMTVVLYFYFSTLWTDSKVNIILDSVIDVDQIL